MCPIYKIYYKKLNIKYNISKKTYICSEKLKHRISVSVHAFPKRIRDFTFKSHFNLPSAYYVEVKQNKYYYGLLSLRSLF